MIIRIDDYPTGVKPVVDDRFNKFMDILKPLEESKLLYHLGIVPMLITKDDISFLKELKYCRPCIHGYDHNYFIWYYSKNREEFRNAFGLPFKKEKIKQILKESKERLKEINLSKMYIPTFNRIHQNLIDALCESNFKSITTGVTVKENLDFKNLIVHTPKNIFCGTSTFINNNIHKFEKDDHICLHLTWEVKEKNKSSDWKLPQIINHIKETL
tara:strand:- start:2339 stop:2980 length:642 start_codon:yes stop_codon:yes gene_type:complete